ncbi:TATA-binding -associated factor 172 [Pelobates cultripes]|uniref:TATA-binding -associated factor 172, partial n=1 Tax=Pelobates cultripes TaxID=61616 RepID=A0AAD1RCN1_PELCU|nr:TATA-binding -associated factor 172 [Pelobates cultripes]
MAYGDTMLLIAAVFRRLLWQRDVAASCEGPQLIYDWEVIPVIARMRRCAEQTPSIGRYKEQLVCMNIKLSIQNRVNGKAQKNYLIQRRGAEFTLSTIARHFGSDLMKALPQVWEAMVGPLRSNINIDHFDGKVLLDKGDDPAQELVNSLQVFEVTAASMNTELHPLLLQHLPHLFMCLQHPYTAVRHMAARCVGVMSRIATMETMNTTLEKVLPWLGAIDDNTKQEGAIEALACVMEQLDVGIVPYIVLLVVPVLGRMSDQTDSVRFMATQCFATLIRLMPLEVQKDSLWSSRSLLTENDGSASPPPCVPPPFPLHATSNLLRGSDVN